MDIDNLSIVNTYPPYCLNGSDSITTNSDLRKLRDLELLVQKGKSKFTYYVAPPALSNLINGEKTVISAPPQTLSAPPRTPSAQPLIQEKLSWRRAKSKEAITGVILDLCEWKPLKIKEIARLIDKSEKYLLREYPFVG